MRFEAPNSRCRRLTSSPASYSSTTDTCASMRRAWD